MKKHPRPPTVLADFLEHGHAVLEKALERQARGQHIGRAREIEAELVGVLGADPQSVELAEDLARHLRIPAVVVLSGLAWALAPHLENDEAIRTDRGCARAPLAAVLFPVDPGAASAPVVRGTEARRRLAARGLTRRQLATATGRTAQAVGNWMTGRSLPGPRSRRLLEQRAGIPVGLWDEEDKP